MDLYVTAGDMVTLCHYVVLSKPFWHGETILIQGELSKRGGDITTDDKVLVEDRTSVIIPGNLPIFKLGHPPYGQRTKIYETQGWVIEDFEKSLVKQVSSSAIYKYVEDRDYDNNGKVYLTPIKNGVPLSVTLGYVRGLSKKDVMDSVTHFVSQHSLLASEDISPLFVEFFLVKSRSSKTYGKIYSRMPRTKFSPTNQFATIVVDVMCRTNGGSLILFPIESLRCKQNSD